MFEARGVAFVLLDVACLVLGGLPLAAFNLAKIRPYQRGFFCSDDSIKYPFHSGTISSAVLYGVGLALPISCVSGRRSATGPSPSLSGGCVDSPV